MSDGALHRLLPPWEKVDVQRNFSGPITKGSVITLKVPIAGPLRCTWKALHTEVSPTSHFVDIQEGGPFSHWEHEHRFEPSSDSTCIMKDTITYALPLSPIADLLCGKMVESKLERMFTYRHTTVKNDLTCISNYDLPPKKILLAGASGLIGKTLQSFLSTAGHTVITLVRREPRNEHEREWNPSSETLSPEIFNDIDVVIHLSGEPIAQRWTEATKKKILKSRVDSTSLLAKAMSMASSKPKCLLTASGIGYYGDRGDSLLTEEESAGELFLSEVAQKWEAATLPAQDAGIRTAHMRFGAVLTPAGGALAKMLLPFKLGLGGRLGSGRQYFSWIALDDLLYALYHLIAREELSGAFNFCAPQETRNADFCNTLAKTLNRPCLFPVPEIVLKTGLGQMADELLLASTRAVPQKLVDSGFSFQFPELHLALAHMLGRASRERTRC